MLRRRQTVAKQRVNEFQQNILPRSVRLTTLHMLLQTRNQCMNIDGRLIARFVKDVLRMYIAFAGCSKKPLYSFALVIPLGATLLKLLDIFQVLGASSLV